MLATITADEMAKYIQASKTVKGTIIDPTEICIESEQPGEPQLLMGAWEGTSFEFEHPKGQHTLYPMGGFAKHFKWHEELLFVEMKHKTKLHGLQFEINKEKGLFGELVCNIMIAEPTNRSDGSSVQKFNANSAKAEWSCPIENIYEKDGYVNATVKPRALTVGNVKNLDVDTASWYKFSLKLSFKVTPNLEKTLERMQTLKNIAAAEELHGPGTVNPLIRRSDERKSGLHKGSRATRQFKQEKRHARREKRRQTKSRNASCDNNIINGSTGAVKPDNTSASQD